MNGAKTSVLPVLAEEVARHVYCAQRDGDRAVGVITCARDRGYVSAACATVEELHDLDDRVRRLVESAAHHANLALNLLHTTINENDAQCDWRVNDLNEIDAQLDDTVPYYVPALVAELREKRAEVVALRSEIRTREVGRVHQFNTINELRREIGGDSFTELRKAYFEINTLKTALRAANGKTEAAEKHLAIARDEVNRLAERLMCTIGVGDGLGVFGSNAAISKLQAMFCELRNAKFENATLNAVVDRLSKVLQLQHSHYSTHAGKEVKQR
jgi:hypothetical protein